VKLHYYADTDSLYVEFQERPSVDTREIAVDVRLDLDAEGRPVGLDIDHASRILDLDTLETKGLPLQPAGPGPRPRAEMKLRTRIADKLFGSDYQWSILAAGRHQIPLCTMGATMGANVRGGLEDSIYVGKGELTKSNAEQVTRIRTILSLEVATPAEARAMLALKGGDQVAF
jgi:uncharacterized protein YuzE